MGAVFLTVCLMMWYFYSHDELCTKEKSANPNTFTGIVPETHLIAYFIWNVKPQNFVEGVATRGIAVEDPEENDHFLFWKIKDRTEYKQENCNQTTCDQYYVRCFISDDIIDSLKESHFGLLHKNTDERPYRVLFITVVGKHLIPYILVVLIFCMLTVIIHGFLKICLCYMYKQPVTVPPPADNTNAKRSYANADGPGAQFQNAEGPGAAAPKFPRRSARHSS